MALPGFDDRFSDLRDYILTITGEIWEGRGIKRIRDYYSEDCPVKTPAGVSCGVEKVIQGTLATLQEFPDRTLLGEDVIEGGPVSGRYYSSHRILSQMTHKGEGQFGSPSGREAEVMTIADCVCHNNRIVDEWLVRDQSGLALQLGVSPVAMGQALAESDDWPDARALVARWQGTEGELDIDALGDVASRYRELWQDARLDQLGQGYSRAIDAKVPGARQLRGLRQLESFWFEMKAAFPGGRYRLHHYLDLEEPGMPRRVALRWSLETRHQGTGRFGPASGAEVVLLGITHAEIIHGQIVREWQLLDEIAIHAQIAHQQV